MYIEMTSKDGQCKNVEFMCYMEDWCNRSFTTDPVKALHFAILV